MSTKSQKTKQAQTKHKQDIKEDIKSMKIYVTSKIKEMEFSDVEQRQIIRSNLSLADTFLAMPFESKGIDV